MKNNKDNGICLTRNNLYQISGMGFNQIIDMIQEFEVEYSFRFGEKRPKPTVERRDTDIKSHADTVAIAFSTRTIAVEPTISTKDALNMEGGAFMLLVGDKVQVYK